MGHGEDEGIPRRDPNNAFEIDTMERRWPKTNPSITLRCLLSELSPSQSWSHLRAQLLKPDIWKPLLVLPTPLFDKFNLSPNLLI